MNGSATTILRILSGADNRYIIPVYQRRYSWTEENCRRLFDDLKTVAAGSRLNHFFGCIVSSVRGAGAGIEYYIIDGQQRLTTVTLLLLAMRNLINTKRVVPEKASLAEQINESYLIDKFSSGGDCIKLCSVESDRAALRKLFEKSEEDFDHSSALTRNYEFFCKAIPDSGVPVDRLFAALSKLEIISITLDHGDDAQLIFESLNSTGLALTEGDKIRNYVLMGLSPDEQTKFYENYWLKIEELTYGNVSAFVRDILGLKQALIPNIDRVYPEFKAFVTNGELSMEELLQELLAYARLYKQLLDCRCCFEDKNLKEQADACLSRLARLEIAVARPFQLEVLRLVRDKEISEEDALKILLTIESYIFRRYICNVPANSLNRLFAALNSEILRYDGTANDYLAKFIYALRAKQRGARFPVDDEFRQGFEHKDIFHMRGNYRGYIFERFENHGEKAPVDVSGLLDEQKLSVEHIMPQTLTAEWREELGANAEEIHQEWCHRLANLTLTAYNSELSNKPFRVKRDTPKFGYSAGGIRLNASIAAHDCWGEAELRERNREMLARAMKIWELPATDFKPTVKELDSCSLDDECPAFTNIARYSFMGCEQTVKSWAEMFRNVVRELHSNDRSVLTALAYSDADKRPDNCVSCDPEKLNTPTPIDERIYFEAKLSTLSKIRILRKLFELYGKDPADLVFYYEDREGKQTKREQTAEILHEWTLQTKGVTAFPDDRNNVFIRFTTAEMSALVPDADTLSALNTRNPYFCEITSRDGKRIYVRFLVDFRNATDELQELFERINEFYPARVQKQDPCVRTHFTTSKITFGAEPSKEEIFAGLDALLEEIRSFEAELAKKLGIKADI